MGAPSQDPETVTWAEGRWLTTEPPRCLRVCILKASVLGEILTHNRYSINISLTCEWIWGRTILLVLVTLSLLNWQWGLEEIISPKINKPVGCLGGSFVKQLPSAQVMIQGFWDQPHMDSVLSRKPVSPSPTPSACVSALGDSFSVK